MKIIVNIILLTILLLGSCTNKPRESNIVLENSMYTVIKIDSTHYLVSPTTTNGEDKPYILSTYDK